MGTDAKSVFAERLLSSLLNEIVVDTALETHAFLKKARSVCPICGKHCTAKRASLASPPPSKLTNADGSALVQDGAGAKGDGVKPDYYSNNPLFECLVCSRQVSSNRYATHLEKCMGMGLKAPRKNSTRTAKAASHAATRLLNSAGSDSPKKRTASPAPLRPSTEDKQARTMNTEDASDSSKPGATPEPQARGTPTRTQHSSPQTSATNSATRKASPEGPSTSANAEADALDEDTSAMRTSDADGIDDADFPSAFSVSSDSDEDADGVSDGEDPAARADDVDDQEEPELDLDDVDVEGDDDDDGDDEEEDVERNTIDSDNSDDNV